MENRAKKEPKMNSLRIDLKNCPECGSSLKAGVYESGGSELLILVDCQCGFHEEETVDVQELLEREQVL